MAIYLIRHTTPNIEKGICYGQSDLDITDSFIDEVSMIKPHLPENILNVYSSPLQRCRKLAETLFPDHTVSLYDDLMELNCGTWELQKWNDIPKTEIQPWMDDYVNVQVPMGESYVQLHERVIRRFEWVAQQTLPAVMVAHGGVLRSILSHITHTPLKESFDVFTCHYGCVVKISRQEETYTYEILHNVSLAGKEWHRPDK